MIDLAMVWLILIYFGKKKLVKGKNRVEKAGK